MSWLYIACSQAAAKALEDGCASFFFSRTFLLSIYNARRWECESHMARCDGHTAEAGKEVPQEGPFRVLPYPAEDENGVEQENCESKPIFFSNKQTIKSPPS